MITEFLDKRLEILEQLNVLRDLDFEEGRELAEIKRIKQLIIDSVSGSALIKKAETMQKENEHLINEARGHWDKEYEKAIGIGIDRITKLIKRHYH